MTDSQFTPATNDDLEGIAGQLAGILAKGTHTDAFVVSTREIGDTELGIIAEKILRLSGRKVVLICNEVKPTREDGTDTAWNVGIVPDK